MGKYMKFDEKLDKISEKSQSKKDRIGIILGVSLLIACGLSYFVLDAFAQQEFLIDCPKNAYHGLDSQGNAACRDILTNQILEPVTRTIIDSDLEKNTSDSSIINISEMGQIFSVDQIPIVDPVPVILISSQNHHGKPWNLSESSLNLLLIESKINT